MLYLMDFHASKHHVFKTVFKNELHGVPARCILHTEPRRHGLVISLEALSRPSTVQFPANFLPCRNIELIIHWSVEP